ncbi:hypothetical protein SEMRO_1299_G260710.1 [Seminavis robusta]|uniref:Uncharacterized protein n=1 Tax=Seminavis robusta TaxID=568900 RepID=A0A9N8HP85_9STRA|nr:hypothetical protein SEMRO_1299_G260710.1 [Seminavis robusta]|eukprot:Sro1299_g260710.1 n/a (257) ;mRNA; r:30475-31398
MDKPGTDWIEEAKKKLASFRTICMLLKDRHLLPQPMLFTMVMEFIGSDSLRPALDFNGRVFIYMVGLVISQKRIQKVIKDYDDKNLVAATIKSISAKLLEPELKHEGKIPTNKKDLMTICSKNVASLLMSHVFGSTELVVGLHARKILVALDMYDWEESGMTQKADVKMANIPASMVKKSLKTWLPKGESHDFFDMMDTLGSLFPTKAGVWGKITKPINAHFSPKEKEMAIGMVTTISQSYKATKVGGRETRRCAA